MKTTATRWWLVGLMAVLFLQGCGGSEHYGEVLAQKETTPISDILADPAAYSGKTVRVSGKISTECPAGCWFELGDGPAVLYVDIGGQERTAIRMAVEPR